MPVIDASTNSSLIAVDCVRQRAYVPLSFLDANLHGEVAVVDLTIDPDKENPVIKVIDTGLIALPRAAAANLQTGQVVVLADPVTDTGSVILINESDFSFTTFPFPIGSRPDETSGVVVDDKANQALISMADVTGLCPGEVGTCTGIASFDLTTKKFGTLTPTFVDVNSFALDASDQTSIGSSDELFNSELLAFDRASPNFPCILDDGSVQSLNADPDGIAVDPATHIWVAGNFDSPLTSVINLNRAAFQGAGTMDCHLVEAGIQPNSKNIGTGSKAAGMPGVAINPVTHAAFLTADSGNQISLMNLPQTSVTQLTTANITSVTSTLPDDPEGTPFVSATFPYGTAVDSCHNVGFALEDTRGFLAEVDLTKFKNDPALISTALPSGHCAGTTTTQFLCNNGNGVTFLPLPSPAPEGSVSKMGPQLIETKPRKKKTGA